MYINQLAAKAIAWLMVFLQFIFPVMLSASPAIAAVREAQAVNSLLPALPVPTTGYTLIGDDSLATVARKYGLSLDELKKLNHKNEKVQRENVQAGDAIEVPFLYHPAKKTAKQPDELPGAGLLSQSAQTLASRSENKVSDLGRTLALPPLQSATQSWLNQFGNAKVQLNVANNFSLKGSAIDYLLPLYDSPANLFFTQLGFRHAESRNTLNIGLGYRTFTEWWMLGANAFYDNDITGNNRRYGIGVEAGMDYLTFSANSYIRLSDWRQSRDVTDYNERPASGFDVRVKSYLPSYPQLGGSVMFEQYYGDEVGLFGRDSRQKNPSAITAGVNYTPVSLLTLGLEHKVGQAGKRDTLGKINFTYRLGVPWKDQISSFGGAEKYLLSQMRNNHVDRNNTIVLEYQKQEMIKLALPTRVSGKGSLSGQITGTLPVLKYSLKNVEWNVSELPAGAVKDPASGLSLNFTFPAFNPASGARNTYRVTAVAEDVKGNISNAAETLIVVDSQWAELKNLVITRNNALANNLDVNTVAAIITDRLGNPVAGQPVTFSADSGVKVSSPRVVSDSQGKAVINLTHIQAGDSTVTAKMGETTSAAKITFVADSNTLALALGVVTNQQVADGRALNKVKAVARDANGNLLADQEVSFSLEPAVAGAGITTATQTVKTNARGEAEATLVSTKAGTVTVKAVSGKVSATVDTAFAADTSTARIETANLTVTRNNALANGVATNAVQAIVTDAGGNLLAGQGVTFTAGNGAKVTAVIATSDADGKATATLSNATAGISKVTVTLGNKVSATVDTTFVADTSTLALTLDVVTNQQVADGRALNKVKAVARDANGNLLADQEVSFSLEPAVAGAGITTATQKVKTNGQGEAEATLTSAKAGTVTVKAVSGKVSATVDTTFVFDPNTLTLSINRVNDDGDVLADGKGFREVRVVTTDANGNIAPSTHIIIDGDNGSTVNGVLLTDGGATRPSAAGAGKVALVTGDDGTITFRVTSLIADIPGRNRVSVGAAIAGKPRGNKEVTLHFSPDLSRAKLELTVVKNNAVADGVDKNRVSVVVRDGISGYELPGIEVIFDGGLVTANGVALGDNGATAPMQPGKGRVSVTTSYEGVTELELTSKTIGTTQSWVGAGIRGQARSVHTWLAFNNVFVGDIQRLTWDSSCNGSFEGIKTLGLETVRVLLDASSMGPRCDSRARQALRWTLTNGVSVNNLNPNVLWDNKLELRCRVGDGATGTIEFTKGGVKTLLHVTCS